MNDFWQLVGELSLTPHVVNGKCKLKYCIQNADSRLVGEQILFKWLSCPLHVNLLGFLPLKRNFVERRSRLPAPPRFFLVAFFFFKKGNAFRRR